MVIERTALALALAQFFLAAVLLFSAVLRHIPRWASVGIPCALVLMWGSFLHIHRVNHDLSGQVFVTDVHMFSDYAASLVRMGENPYHYDTLDAYRVYRASKLYSTPLINGDVIGGVSYPSLSFLIYLPFQWLGIDTSLIYPLALLIGLLLIYGIAPSSIRPLAVVPFLVNPNYTLYALGGVNDIVWAVLLCLMVVMWRRVVWAGLWFGLACAIKQQPWFLAPFLLVRLWHDAPAAARPRVVIQFSLIAAGSFLILNAPFIAADPAAWFNGILLPLTEPMILLGQGFSSLTLFGVIFFPQWVFFGLTYGLLLALLLLYIRFFHHWRDMLWIAPAVALWFAHRSLSSYWYFYLLPLVASILMTLRDAEAAEAQPSTVSPAFSPVWLVSFGIGAGAAVVAAIFAFVPNPIRVELIEPLRYESGETQISLRVSNQGERALTPRFSLQSWGEQPAFWNILHGDDQLEPNTDGVYTLISRGNTDGFNLAVGAQIIVSDANSYGVRASTFLPPASFAYVDRLPNSEFVYWNADGSAPYGWGRLGGAGDGAITLTHFEGERALRFDVNPPEGQSASVALDTWLMLPETPMEIWVQPPPDANLAPDFDALYGLEIVLTANGRRFFVLFGDETAAGTLPDSTPYTMIAAPEGVWSRQTVRLPAIIEQLDLPLPAPQMRAVGSLQLPMRMTNFRLYARANQPMAAYFGTISHPPSADAPPDARIADAVAHPDQVLLWRGDLNLEAHNYESASDYFTLALAANPELGEAAYGLGAARVALGDYAEVQTLLEQALTLGYPAQTRVYQSLGWLHLGMNQPEAAQLAFTTALDRFSSDGVVYGSSVEADLYKGLALALMQQGRLALAESMFTRAQALDPSDLELYTLLQSLYIDQGRCAAVDALVRNAARFGFPLPASLCEVVDAS
ncbi:MAG: tetratricopeptide repeat protein [Chloroflexota bacterium]|nr:tetratricopeptide repeat protein [Chloroflexota bacterium]